MGPGGIGSPPSWFLDFKVSSEINGGFMTEFLRTDTRPKNGHRNNKRNRPEYRQSNIGGAASYIPSRKDYRRREQAADERESTGSMDHQRSVDTVGNGEDIQRVTRSDRSARTVSRDGQ